MIKTMPSPDEREAVTYGETAVKWATQLHSAVDAGVNARKAAHKAYLVIGRPRGIKRKVIPIFDKRRDYGRRRLNQVRKGVPEPELS